MSTGLIASITTKKCIITGKPNLEGIAGSFTGTLVSQNYLLFCFMCYKKVSVKNIANREKNNILNCQ